MASRCAMRSRRVGGSIRSHGRLRAAAKDGAGPDREQWSKDQAHRLRRRGPRHLIDGDPTAENEITSRSRARASRPSSSSSGPAGMDEAPRAFAVRRRVPGGRVPDTRHPGRIVDVGATDRPCGRRSGDSRRRPRGVVKQSASVPALVAFLGGRAAGHGDPQWKSADGPRLASVVGGGVRRVPVLAGGAASLLRPGSRCGEWRARRGRPPRSSSRRRRRRAGTWALAKASSSQSRGRLPNNGAASSGPGLDASRPWAGTIAHTELAEELWARGSRRVVRVLGTPAVSRRHGLRARAVGVGKGLSSVSVRFGTARRLRPRRRETRGAGGGSWPTGSLT